MDESLKIDLSRDWLFYEVFMSYFIFKLICSHNWIELNNSQAGKMTTLDEHV